MYQPQVRGASQTKKQHPKMNTNRKNRAFTLLEVMIGIAALAIVAIISFSGITEMRTSVKSKKLKQDVAVVNTAVRMYLTHGGEIGTLSSPQAIIDKLGLEKDVVVKAYHDALVWADEQTQMTNG